VLESLCGKHSLTHTLTHTHTHTQSCQFKAIAIHSVVSAYYATVALYLARANGAPATQWTVACDTDNSTIGTQPGWRWSVCKKDRVCQCYHYSWPMVANVFLLITKPSLPASTLCCLVTHVWLVRLVRPSATQRIGSSKYLTNISYDVCSMSCFCCFVSSNFRQSCIVLCQHQLIFIRCNW